MPKRKLDDLNEASASETNHDEQSSALIEDNKDDGNTLCEDEKADGEKLLELVFSVLTAHKIKELHI